MGSINNQHQALMKCDLPIFKEEGIEGSIQSIECYFRINKILDQERLRFVSTCMKVMALDWFIWIEDYYSFKDWQDFKIYIGTCFGHSLFDNILHQFLVIVQEGTINNYR